MVLRSRDIEFIKRHEGCRLIAYKCPANVLTIGYGHTGSDVSDGMVISQEEADRLLAKDLAVFEKAVLEATKGVVLTSNQFAALVSFTYNVGARNLNNSTLLKRVKADQSDPDIVNQFRRWNKAGSTVLPGLVKRREEELKLYFLK
ncbi:MAG: lysozyme [Bacteroidales bacterium]